MIPLDYVLAVAMLSAPPVDRPCPLGNEARALMAPLREVALCQEVMDPREVGYLLARPEDMAADVQIVRRRWHSLCDAPPVGDALRFPTNKLAAELLEFNRAYRAHLVRRHEVEGTRRDELAGAIAEADQLYHVWDAVRDASCDCYYVTVRREALLNLRQAVGPQAYYSGTLPPHVPLWHFGRAN